MAVLKGSSPLVTTVEPIGKQSNVLCKTGVKTLKQLSLKTYPDLKRQEKEQGTEKGELFHRRRVRKSLPALVKVQRFQRFNSSSTKKQQVFHLFFLELESVG